MLACIGKRISAALLQPCDKNENYITSLHNGAVCIIQCYFINSLSLHHSLNLAGCCVDCWTSAIWWQISCAQVCWSHLPQFFRYYEAWQLYCTKQKLAAHGKVQSSETPQFNFREWWKITGEPFDVHDVLIKGLVDLLEKVCTFLQLPVPKLTKTSAES